MALWSLTMLVLDNVKTVYNDVVLALREISLSLEEGKIAVLLGGNGAGKSSTLKSISGVIHTENGKLAEGKIEFDGKRIDRMLPEDIARLGICHVLQGRSVFAHLTTEENLMMGAYLRRDKQAVNQDLKRVYEYFPKLAALRKRASGYLSGGEQQMVVIGRAFMSRAKVLLLDEPSTGLAVSVIKEIFPILKQINQNEKTSMLIAEQNAIAALAIADFGYVLQNGKITSSGPSADLMKDHAQVKGAYLGLSEDGTFFNYHNIQRNVKVDNGR